MAKRTQKAGATARFGARYGVSVRRRAGSAISKKSRVYTCPSCHYRKVRRKSAGIWEGRKCGYTFSGGVCFQHLQSQGSGFQSSLAPEALGLNGPGGMGEAQRNFLDLGPHFLDLGPFFASLVRLCQFTPFIATI